MVLHWYLLSPFTLSVFVLVLRRVFDRKINHLQRNPLLSLFCFLLFLSHFPTRTSLYGSILLFFIKLQRLRQTSSPVFIFYPSVFPQAQTLFSPCWQAHSALLKFPDIFSSYSHGLQFYLVELDQVRAACE